MPLALCEAVLASPMRLLLPILLLAFGLTLLAQEGPPVPTNASTLKALVESLSSLRAQLQVQASIARSGESDAIKDAAKREVASIETRIAQTQRDFDSIATGVDERALMPVAVGKFDATAELGELLTPLMQELKQVTEQPRMIERLRGEVSTQQRRLELAKLAVANAEAMLKSLPKSKDSAADAPLRKALQETQRKWQATASEATGTLEATRFRLNDALAKRKSLWELLTHAAKNFFLTRGLNLVLGVITFFAAFLGWRGMHRWVIKFSPWHKTGSDRPFFTRVLDVIYHALAIVVGTVAALTVLYSVGDWLLLGLSLITLLALILAAKNGLPRYYSQARLMLNLGEVREGERVVLHGLPWEVKSINMFTELANPVLRHGRLRVPITQITGLSSRPSIQGEPWFPCAEGDWVQLADTTFGKVVSITSDFVQLVQHGGAHKMYPTHNFILQYPVNLAGGFRAAAIVKVHPEHRALATDVIPDTLKESIHAGLLTLIDPPDIKSLKVEFRAVIPNALEFDVIADFAGGVAEKLPTLQRALQRHALAACNDQGWKLGA